MLQENQVDTVEHLNIPQTLNRW